MHYQTSHNTGLAEHMWHDATQIPAMHGLPAQHAGLDSAAGAMAGKQASSRTADARNRQEWLLTPLSTSVQDW